MTTLMFAHGGTVGLLVELAFVAVPILVFVAMAIVSSRRARRSESGGDVEP